MYIHGHICMHVAKHTPMFMMLRSPVSHNLFCYKRPPQPGKPHGVLQESPDQTVMIKSHQITKTPTALGSVPYPTYGAGLY